MFRRFQGRTYLEVHGWLTAKTLPWTPCAGTVTGSSTRHYNQLEAAYGVIEGNFGE